MSNTTIFQEQASGKSHKVHLPCVIGRGVEADLSLPDHTVSHRHALVEMIDGRIWILDLGSANGVFVNRVRIREKTPLQSGELIRLGQLELVMLLQEEVLLDRTLILPPLDPTQEPSLDLKRLRFIYELTSEMAVNQDLDALEDTITGRLRGFFGQDRVYIALFHEDGSLEPIFMRSSAPGLPVSRTIINRIIALRIRSALCVPLVHRRTIYGLIYLDKGVPGAYSREDLEFLRSIGFILGPLIENAHLYHELKQTFYHTVQALAETLDKRDPYTGGHTRRVMEYSLAIGREMGLAGGILENLKLAAILHDIGKIGIRDLILLKQESLSIEEAETMHRHSEYGADILEHVEQLKEVIPGVRSHHEKYDGSGYPDHLKGEDIPLIARIIAVADTFDAMTTDRPYQKAMSPEEALRKMKRNEGTQLDTEIVEKFIQCCKTQ
jgi:putative nucleotidyltransferase with HDIG domain